MRRFKLLVGVGWLWFSLLWIVPNVGARDGTAVVTDAVTGILERLQRELPADQLVGLTVPQVEAFLNPAEREVLGARYIQLRVNVPVVVTIAQDARLGDDPFWLRERGFETAGGKVRLGTREYKVWTKAFAAGAIGLGVPSLSGHGSHYLAFLRPQEAGRVLKVTQLRPTDLAVAPFVAGVAPYVDQDVRWTNIPSELEGQLLVRMASNRVKLARLISLFYNTEYPATNRADQVLLTWSGDPRTTQTIQWRTSPAIQRGVARYQLKSDGADFNRLFTRSKPARTERLETRRLLNDPQINRHTVELKGLQPASTYLYSVGDGTDAGWTAPAEFTTAPAAAVSFSFVYMGDAQSGLDQWGRLLRHAYQAQPEAAFYLMAGDLVDRGDGRWNWDSLFANAKGVFDRQPLVPVIGNHECQGGEPELYLAQFTLPRNGPRGVTPGRAYAFEYSNAKFVVLDSNLEPATQTKWLERQLADRRPVWKFVSYHHPFYSAGANRDNAALRQAWEPLFDKYQVDLALEGHDHVYLRTYPMHDQRRAASPREGTVHVISVSGTKLYDLPEHDYTEVGFSKIPTYQVLDIQVNGSRLVYRARDVDGTIRDEFVIEK